MTSKPGGNTTLNLLKTPGLLVQITATGARKLIQAPIDYLLRNGIAGPFSRLDIKLTNSCNLRCEMCHQWGDSGWHLDQEPSFFANLVPLERYQKLIEEVSDWSPWVVLLGGEPFLYPSLLSLAKTIKMTRLPLTISTNGTMLVSHAEELVRLGVDFLLISIDGGREVHDRIRRSPGCFDKILEGIGAIQRQKLQQKRTRPFLVISTVVTAANAGCLDDVFLVAEEAGVDGLSTAFGWYQTEESCRRYEDIMASKFNVCAMTPRGFVREVAAIDTAALVDTVNRIRARRWSFRYRFRPDLMAEEIPRYFTDHGRTFSHKRCLVPWWVVYALPNGDVTTCGDYPDYIVGNILRSGIRDIWNNERYRKFRQTVKQDGLLPICSRCCGLLIDS